MTGTQAFTHSLTVQKISQYVYSAGARWDTNKTEFRAARRPYSPIGMRSSAGSSAQLGLHRTRGALQCRSPIWYSFLLYLLQHRRLRFCLLKRGSFFDDSSLIVAYYFFLQSGQSQWFLSLPAAIEINFLWSQSHMHTRNLYGTDVCDAALSQMSYFFSCF